MSDRKYWKDERGCRVEFGGDVQCFDVKQSRTFDGGSEEVTLQVDKTLDLGFVRIEISQRLHWNSFLASLSAGRGGRAKIDLDQRQQAALYRLLRESIGRRVEREVDDAERALFEFRDEDLDGGYDLAADTEIWFRHATEAARLYGRAKETGDAWAQLLLAVHFDKGEGVEKNSAIAAMWCRRAAEQGLVHAQETLGSRYEIGDGVRKNYTEAAKWYRRAAEQGQPYAQYRLGWMYENGTGVPQSNTDAAEWYRRAAELGFLLGQLAIATSYRSGRGVEQDFVQAHKWFNLASKNEHHDLTELEWTEDAAVARREVQAKMTEKSIAEAERLAREWKPRP